MDEKIKEKVIELIKLRYQARVGLLSGDVKALAKLRKELKELLYKK